MDIVVVKSFGRLCCGFHFLRIFTPCPCPWAIWLLHFSGAVRSTSVWLSIVTFRHAHWFKSHTDQTKMQKLSYCRCIKCVIVPLPSVLDAGTGTLCSPPSVLTECYLAWTGNRSESPLILSHTLCTLNLLHFSQSVGYQLYKPGVYCDCGRNW